MHRFYLPSPDVAGNVITIKEKSLIHQLSKVLRAKPGDVFSVFDDTGKEKIVSLLEMSRKEALVQIVEPVNSSKEPKLNVTLYFSIPKKTGLFDLVVQKATELGVSEIVPLITERTEKRRMSKFERMKTIAIEATEQSGRTKVPVIRHPITLAMALKKITNGYMAYELEHKKFLPSYSKTLSKGGRAQLIVGPEGGLSHVEVEMAKKAGIKLFTLGSRILRMETAAIVSLGLLMSGQDI